MATGGGITGVLSRAKGACGDPGGFGGAAGTAAQPISLAPMVSSGGGGGGGGGSAPAVVYERVAGWCEGAGVKGLDGVVIPEVV